jgi:hypothetical protein
MAACANAIAKRPRRPDLSMPLPLGVMEACFSLKTRQIQASTPAGSLKLPKGLTRNRQRTGKTSDRRGSRSSHNPRLGHPYRGINHAFG